VPEAETGPVAASRAFLLATRREEPTDDRRTALAGLDGGRLAALDRDAATAFWLNAYNAAVQDDRFLGDGTTWDAATGESADGRALARVPSRRLSAFAWQDDRGPDAFYAP
jgi:hypothetical protein